MCNEIRVELLGEVPFPFLSANVMYGVLSKRLHQPDEGNELYVGNDEGDAVIKFYEVLAQRYGFIIKTLSRDEQVAYTDFIKAGG